MKKLVLSIVITAFALAVFFYETAETSESNNNLIIENAEALAGIPEKIAATCDGRGHCTITNEVDWETVYVFVNSSER